MTERDGDRAHRLFLRLVYLGLAGVVVAVLWSRVRPPATTSREVIVEDRSGRALFGGPPPAPLTLSPDAPRLIRWCAVRSVLERRCHRCHGSPRNYGAPFSLLTYSDVIREYPEGSGRQVVDRMTHVIRHRVMPPTTLPLDPPVEPLENREKDILLAWVEEGALAFGGESCAP